MSEKLKLISPWIDYYRKVEALFRADDDIEVNYDDDQKVIKLLVEGTPSKIDALTRIMPEKVSFGEVELCIEVVPANQEIKDDLELLACAFAGNPAFSFGCHHESVFGTMLYAVFAREVVQYYSDKINEYRGLTSTLYADIAKEIFKDTVHGVFFTTEG